MNDHHSVRADLYPAAALASITDVEVFHRKHAHAVDRVRDLEGRLEQAFHALYDARQELIDRAGVSAITEFTEPVRAAWGKWLAAHEAGEMAHAPRSEEEWRLERENAALALVAKASEQT